MSEAMKKKTESVKRLIDRVNTLKRDLRKSELQRRKVTRECEKLKEKELSSIPVNKEQTKQVDSMIIYTHNFQISMWY